MRTPTIKDAFYAGYHCQWLRAAQRYTFDPALKPGDPNGAYWAWRQQVSPGQIDNVTLEEEHGPTTEAREE